jgi:hypothetical protein
MSIANMNRAISVKGQAGVGSSVTNITFSDITFHNIVEYGMFINLNYRKSSNDSLPHSVLNGIRFESIKGSSLTAGTGIIFVELFCIPCSFLPICLLPFSFLFLQASFPALKTRRVRILLSKTSPSLPFLAGPSANTFTGRRKG